MHKICYNIIKDTFLQEETTMTTAPKHIRAPRIVAASLMGFLALVLSVPSLYLLNRSAEAMEGESAVYMLTRWGLSVEGALLMIGLALAVALGGTAAWVFLRPARMKVAVAAGYPAVGAVETAAPTANTAESPEITVNSTVAQPCKTVPLPQFAVTPNGYELADNTPIRVYHTRIMGSSLLEGGNRQATLCRCRAGEILILKTKFLDDGSRAVACYTTSGDLLGSLDASVVRSIRECYPRHRIGAVLERIEGGGPRPYEGYIAVTVYRTPPVADLGERIKPRRA